MILKVEVEVEEFLQTERQQVVGQQQERSKLLAVGRLVMESL